MEASTNSVMFVKESAQLSFRFTYYDFADLKLSLSLSLSLCMCVYIYTVASIKIRTMLRKSLNVK